MNIKSLLFGSAAALVAVSGARAADAVVVAEPEPAEYVRICDVYGAGYFYIPGTETCLRIGGYVRYDIAAGGVAGGHENVTDKLDGTANDTWHKQGRFTFKTWTGQETEMGTLKTYTETRFNFNDGWERNSTTGASTAGSQWTLNFAWIQLGGFRVGKDESAFDTFIGYAGNVINDTIVPYGSFDTNVIQYYFDGGNGFSAVISLEDGSGTNTIDSYVPHIVAGAKYTQGWGGITGVFAYDSNYEEWAGKVRLDVNATEQLSLFVMGGYGSDENAPGNFYKLWEENWAVWGGGTYKLNEKASLNAQLSYDEGENFGAAVNVAYDLVPGFTVTGEVNYYNDGKAVGDSDSWGGIIRFQRDF
ncbi:MAG: porin [Mesorhizobium sp.]